MSDLVQLQALITLNPGCAAAFERLARRLAADTLEREPGCLRYEYVRRTEPDSYLSTMVFVDHDAFLVHQASEHHVTLAGEMRDLIASLELERLDPISGCSPFSPADGGPTDDRPPLVEAPEVVLAERTAHYAERYPLEPASWW